MSVQSSFYEYCNDQSGITDLVSSRIYPMVAPKSAALPYVVYQSISTARSPHLSGSSGLVQERVQVVCYADDPVEAESVAEAFRAELDGFTCGTMGTAGNALWVQAVMLEGQNTGYVESADENEEGTYYDMADYIFWYRESVPTF